jgi:hypothetical protein
MPHHAFGHAGLTDIDTHLEQFPTDMGRAPQRIFTAYFADQIAGLACNRGPTHSATPDLPLPEQAKSLAMPRDHSGRREDVQSRAPVKENEVSDRHSQNEAYSQ